MEKFIAAGSPSPRARNLNSSSLRSIKSRWKKMLLELDGRVRSQYRHETAQRLLNSYSQVGIFPHAYGNSLNRCETVEWLSYARQDHLSREGFTDLDFDSKGVYLACVTQSGCFVVHDFESLYSSIYGPSSDLREGDRKCLLHQSINHSLDAVCWNRADEYEVACASRRSNRILLYDIGYESPDPIEVLKKGKSRFSVHGFEGGNGISDVVFSAADKSRLLASGLDGAIYIWDRRLSDSPCVELTNIQSQLNSLQLDTEERIVFGASSQGMIYAWDLRGGRTSLAFQSHNQVYYPLLSSVKVSSLLEQIPSLKAQTHILPREIFSIRFNPSSLCQIAFHLADGWSGVLDIIRLNITHIHCPPPPLYWSNLMIKKATWLPTCSVYVVGSSSDEGVHFLDFYPDTRSACHVDFDENVVDSLGQRGRSGRNNFVSSMEDVVVCSAHPPQRNCCSWNEGK